MAAPFFGNLSDRAIARKRHRTPPRFQFRVLPLFVPVAVDWCGLQAGDFFFENWLIVRRSERKRQIAAGSRFAGSRLPFSRTAVRVPEVSSASLQFAFALQVMAIPR